MGVLTLTGTSATATAGAQPKYDALGGLAVQARVRVDELRSAAGYVSLNLFEASGKDGLTFSLYPADPGQFGFRHFETAQGNSFTATNLLLSALPANGNDVVIYCERTTATVRFAIGTPDGAEIVSGSVVSGAGAPGITSVGSGAIAIPASSPQPGLVFDSLAVLNAARTGNARFALPLTSDADVVGLYYFDETSGSTTADAEGGTPLTLAGGATLSAGGSWNGGGGGGIAPGTRVLLNYYN